ncbi:hypothetical protein [uncultured Ralstonia sp.]|jgi:hypothetical protein|uniref:hypothetical protein n=1 Tax=Ralstonia sp. TaxID=54061 RepID=UPI0025FA693C|nr:hypothetical protein [uncultured Ralstonia sp.]
MTHSIPQSVDTQRFEAHAELFDKLSKLRTLLGMLHSGGFDHFRRLDETRQAEYLWTCMEYADGAYAAMLTSDGIVGNSLPNG